MKRPDWFDALQPYAMSDANKALIYILTSIAPYLLLLAIMIFLMTGGFPYWLIMVLSVPAAGFYVRTFILLHDCAHLSFIKSKRGNFVLGHICGFLTATPFFDWQRNHGIHHANVGNLDKRGIGDVWTMTLQEYRASGFWGRWWYRFFRNPLVIFTISPVVLFVIMYRFPQKSTRRKDYFSIVVTDIFLVLMVIVAGYTIGIQNYIAVQLPVLYLAVSAGMYLFYIQHQFETVYWARQAEWDLISAAIQGSSFFRLPGLLRWFTGNIGYHHIHHLKPRIPGYNLKQCYDTVTGLHYAVPITLRSSFASLRLRLWDEESRRLISFPDAHKIIKSEAMIG